MRYAPITTFRATPAGSGSPDGGDVDVGREPAGGFEVDMAPVGDVLPNSCQPPRRRRYGGRVGRVMDRADSPTRPCLRSSLSAPPVGLTPGVAGLEVRTAEKCSQDHNGRCTVSLQMPLEDQNRVTMLLTCHRSATAAGAARSTRVDCKYGLMAKL